MEKLEFKGKDSNDKYERKKKEKWLFINEIGQIFYEVLSLKKNKEKKIFKKSKKYIEEGLANLKIKVRKAIKYMKLMLLYKKIEGKIIENEIDIFRKIVKGLNKK